MYAYKNDPQADFVIQSSNEKNFLVQKVVLQGYSIWFRERFRVRVAKIPISSDLYLSIPNTESILGIDLSFEKAFRSDPVSVARSR